MEGLRLKKGDDQMNGAVGAARFRSSYSRRTWLGWRLFELASHTARATGSSDIAKVSSQTTSEN